MRKFFECDPVLSETAAARSVIPASHFTHISVHPDKVFVLTLSLLKCLLSVALFGLNEDRITPPRGPVFHCVSNINNCC